MRTRILGLALLFSLSSALTADVLTETLSGTVLSGIDNVGAFGPAGASLAGSAVVVKYMINPIPFGAYHGDGATSENLSDDANALTNTITINGITFTQTNPAGSPEMFTSSGVGGIVYVDSLIGGLGGNGSEIKIFTATPYQYGILANGQDPKPYLDLVSAAATSIHVGIDTHIDGLAFQTDLLIDATPTPTVPEPASVGLLAVAVLVSVYKISKTASIRPS